MGLKLHAMWRQLVGQLELRLLPDTRQSPRSIGAGGWPTALRLLSALQRCTRPDVVILNSAVGACGKARTQVRSWQED